mmetsp:Transcript_4515/g.19181  ORF Transcript_4515/g.19181 Transcript_4515/m.19181 type:complete len:298 (+) Transcript_4515:3800-4693(+)
MREKGSARATSTPGIRPGVPAAGPAPPSASAGDAAASALLVPSVRAASHGPAPLASGAKFASDTRRSRGLVARSATSMPATEGSVAWPTPTPRLKVHGCASSGRSSAGRAPGLAAPSPAAAAAALHAVEADIANRRSTATPCRGGDSRSSGRTGQSGMSTAPLRLCSRKEAKGSSAPSSPLRPWSASTRSTSRAADDEKDTRMPLLAAAAAATASASPGPAAPGRAAAGPLPLVPAAAAPGASASSRLASGPSLFPRFCVSTRSTARSSSGASRSRMGLRTDASTSKPDTGPDDRAR